MSRELPTEGLTRDEAITRMRACPERASLLRDSYLDLPAGAAAERFFRSEEWQEVLRHLGRRPGRALDLGAGNGIASYAFARSGWRVIALEPSLGPVTGARAVASLAREAALVLPVVCAVGERLPFPDESFDVVYSRQVLHHVTDLAGLCADVRRVLRPGGAYLACAEHVVSSERQRRRFLRDHPLHAMSGDENAFDLPTYRAGFRAGGLRIVSQLAPFDSAINFAPYDRASLRAELARRLRGFPAGAAIARVALSEALYPRLLRLLSWIDRRPGRPYSFLATRAA